MTGEIKIHCHEKIFIGRNFSCSWDVVISDTDFHECRNPDDGIIIPKTKSIKIGDNVWCCQHTYISKGSIIPDWTTIAQLSLTNKKYDCTNYSILAGIPAKYMNKKLIREDIFNINSLPDSWLITKGYKVFNNR